MTSSTKPSPSAAKAQSPIAQWKPIVAEFQQPSRWRACWQITNTVGGYALLWYLIYLSRSVSWWLTIPLAILAGGFVIRNFIIFHDCGHGSFFKSKRANTFWGFITGMLTFTPYHHWRWEHSIHHATSGHLDRRGVGDIWTMTVAEYNKSSRATKAFYRFMRNPILLFVIAPLVLMLVLQRFAARKASWRERLSVWGMNLAVVAMSAGLIWVFGFLPWLIIQLTITAVAGTCGVWLFYVQHQFEDVYWESGSDWDYTAAAIEGSSFYKLPRILQWFSGNIGFHHIHHLSPRIPNYNLERCHNSHSMFTDVVPMTLLSSFKAITYRLWDEESRKLISFRSYKELEQNKAS